MGIMEVKKVDYMKTILTNVLISALTLMLLAGIFLAGSYCGEIRMKEYVLVRCQAESPRWYPYPQMCKYFVGDIKGRDE